MRNCVGMTGTPGTGKKTLAPLVASKLGIKCISLYDLAVSSGLVKRGDDEGEVDTAFLRRLLLERTGDQALIYGHLLPYTLKSGDLRRLAVLRCEPAALKRRLVARGYQPKKVVENVEAELIGVLSADSMNLLGKRKVAEFDATSSDPAATARVISGFLSGSREAGPSIDWTFRYGSASKLRSLLCINRSIINLVEQPNGSYRLAKRRKGTLSQA